MSISIFYNKTAIIKRLTYVGDIGTLSTVATIKAYLRALTEQEATENGFQFGQVYALQMDKDTDIKMSDEVEIENKNYRVQGVAKHDQNLPVDHARAILTLSIDE